MMCQLDGCVNEATELYIDKETIQTIHLCLEHYDRAMGINMLEKEEKIKKEKIN